MHAEQWGVRELDNRAEHQRAQPEHCQPLALFRKVSTAYWAFIGEYYNTFRSDESVNPPFPVRLEVRGGTGQ